MGNVKGPTETAEFRMWKATRPASVKKLLDEFPLGTSMNVKGKEHWVIGFNENEQVILSPVDPSKDYDAALKDKIYVCAKHFRVG